MPWIAAPAVAPSADAVAARQRDLYGASFSDVHLGHPQTPTEHILANLKAAFPDTAETASLDLILLGGDLFDSALAYADGLIPQIEEWAIGLLKLCAKDDIALRVLEGTHSHDRNQSSMFGKLAAQHALAVDLRYVDKVWVEVNAKLGCSILYVPDFTTVDEETMWEKVQRAMAEAGVAQVDYVNLHGAFSYQLPAIPEIQRTCHRMDRYLAITRQYLFTGHIHLPSVYERIYCNGSFDRLAHGEEEPKGHWRFRVPKNGEDSLEFRPTPQALTYLTVDCQGLDLETALRKVEAVAEGLKPGSHLRVEAERSHGVFLSMQRWRQSFPFLHWSMKPLANDKSTEGEETLPLQAVVREPMSAETMVGIFTARLRKAELPEPLVAHALALLPTYL